MRTPGFVKASSRPPASATSGTRAISFRANQQLPRHPRIRLQVSGERKEEKEVKEEDFYRSERSYGKTFRSVALPDGCDTDSPQASMKDGLLEVVIPRKAQAAAKKIEVKAQS